MSYPPIDARLVFYLEHQDEIERWAALRRDIRPIAHSFFGGLVAPLRERLGELPGSPVLNDFVAANAAYPSFTLSRSSWWQSGEARPLAGVSFEWPATDLDFRSAYFGVWVNRASTETGVVAAFYERVRPLWEQDPPAPGRSQPTPWYPFRVFTEPTGRYWENQGQFASVLLDRVCELWKATWEVIDEAITPLLPDNAGISS